MPPANTHPLTPSVYWEGRARRFARHTQGLAAVCSYGMPWLYNVAIDLCQRRALAPWLTGAGGGAALDVGCGVGRWSRRLAARGLDVTGVDLSEFMVARASERTRREGFACEFLQSDVNRLRLERRFDLILSVTVLQHIVDADQAAQAISRLREHLAPNGELVLLEAAPLRDTPRCDSSIFRARSLAWYESTLAKVGLQVRCVRGVDPLPFKTVMLPYYKRMSAPLAALASTATAAVSLPLDLLLAPYLPEYSWHKVIVARPMGRAGR